MSLNVLALLFFDLDPNISLDVLDVIVSPRGVGSKNCSKIAQKQQ